MHMVLNNFKGIPQETQIFTLNSSEIGHENLVLTQGTTTESLCLDLIRGEAVQNHQTLRKSFVMHLMVYG